MEEMNPLIQAFGEMLEQKLVVVLDQELDKKLEEKLEEVLDRKLEEVLDRKLEEILDRKLEEILDRKLEEVLDRKLEEVLERKLEEVLDRRLEEVIDRKMEEILERLAVVEETVLQMNVTIENELRPNIQILAENYVPAAKNYEKKSEKIIQMDTDIKILKSVVAGHGKKISRLAGES